MKPVRFLYSFLPLAIVYTITSLLFFSSCKKDKKDNTVIEIPEARTTGNISLLSIGFTPGNQTVTIITLKNQSGGSGGSVHVKLSLDDAAVAAAGATIKLLATSRYTLTTLEYDVPANSTINVPVTINTGNLSVDTVYGIGLKIAQVSSGNIASDAKGVVVKIDVRNRWDGRYKVTGTFTDYVAPTLTFTEYETNLITTGPAAVKSIPKDLGIPGYLILSGTSLSYYGSFGPVLNFDAITNKITSVINFYGQPASNSRSGQLDPSGANQWDASSKNMSVKFWMNDINSVPVFPYHRTLFVNTLVYLGPRF
jgi:hypothetical protein